MPHQHKVKSIVVNGQTRKFGRNRPVAKGPRLRLRNYLLQGLPTPPAIIDYRSSAAAALSNIYLNDTLGDCVIAGMAHVVGVLTGNAGPAPFIFTNDQITALYSAIGGYVPGDPSTDQGCDEVTALNYWQNNGAPGGSHKILGWVSVDYKNPDEYRTAMWLFENLYFGLDLPDAWTQISANGFVWSPGTPDPANGHCVIGCGYDSTGIIIDSWGLTGTITDSAILEVLAPKYGGELYTVVSMDSINAASQLAPNGFAASQLITDFNAMGGNVVLPTPTPVPVPTPTPTPTPSPSPVTKQEVDAVFAYAEVLLAKYPAVVSILKEINAVVDANLPAGGRMAVVPGWLITIIDGAFAVFEAQYPVYAPALVLANKLIDEALAKIG